MTSKTKDFEVTMILFRIIVHLQINPLRIHDDMIMLFLIFRDLSSILYDTILSNSGYKNAHYNYELNLNMQKL